MTGGIEKQQRTAISPDILKELVRNDAVVIQQDRISIKGDLVLDRDVRFDRSLKVEGTITGKGGSRFELDVDGNIFARDITVHDIRSGDIIAWYITARDITARNIYALDIIAVDISARGITARDIIAENVSVENRIHVRNIGATENIRAGNINAEHLVICNGLEVKSKKIFARALIKDIGTLKKHEIEVEGNDQRP